MADDTTTQTAAPDDQTQAMVQQLLQQTLTGQGGITPTQVQEPAHSGDNRTWGSLLGQALVGGAGPGATDAANEQAGLRGLMSVGLGMMSGSDYSRAKHSLGSIVADAIGGAQQGNYEQQTAMLAYQKQQQEMQLERVKTALPLLTQLTSLQQLAAARRASGDATGAPGANTSIAAVGAVPPGTLAPNEAPINAAGDSATRKASEGGPPAPGTPAAKTAQQVHDFWIGKGFSEAQVAGIMAGGPGSESNFDPTASGDKGTSYGLYQHHADRLDGMRKYFGLSGDQMPTADQQNQYAAWELSPQGPKAAVGAALSKAQTPAEAAAIYTRSFGVPADKTEIGRRAAGAGRYMGLYGQPPPPGTPPAPVIAQTPPAGPTGAQALPVPPIPPPGGPPPAGLGALGGGGPLTPPGAAPPSLAGPIAEATRGAETGPLPLPATAGKGVPIPPGNLQTTGKPPGQAAADAIMGGAQLAQATPVLPGTGLAAGPPGIGQPAQLGSVVPGGETGFAPTAAAPPVTQPPPPVPPAAIAPPGAQQPPAPAVERVPDTPPPYVRGALPPEIQAEIDHPTIDPHLIAAQNTARAGSDIKAIVDATAAVGAATDKARAEALTRAEAYHTAQQNIVTEAWKVRRAEQAASDTALQKQAFDERQATIGSANTRVNAEAADLGKRNAEIDKTYGDNAQAGTTSRAAVAQVRPLLQNLPGGTSLLSNETTRPIAAAIFGNADQKFADKATNADLFVASMNRAADAMSPRAITGSERPSNINQYKAMLPSLATSPEGKELALNYVDDIGKNQQDNYEWLQTHAEDPAFMNKRLSTPNRALAEIAMRKDPTQQMPQLPPMPTTFDAKAYLADPRNAKAEATYGKSIIPGRDFYTWKASLSDGRMHAVKNTWTPNGRGGFTVVPGEAP